MLFLNGNVLVELSVLTQLRVSDTLAFISSHQGFQDVRIAETALEVARLRMTAGDFLGAYRYAAAARAIGIIVGDRRTVEQSETVCERVAFSVGDTELFDCRPLP
jgi:hypothetical protein